MKTAAVVGLMLVLCGADPDAQPGQITGRIGQAGDSIQKASKAIQDLRFTDAEERQLGADVSARLRDRYGVVQDAAVHKYVALVGAVIAANSAAKNLQWTFIVLDTDGVNAFAAPGGFVHITRGALGLIRNEAELAGVIAHEIVHVMSRHTIRTIQKTKIEGAFAKAATRDAFLRETGNRLYAITLENSFDRGDEMDADKFAVALASEAGYSPSGLSAFLASLAERNKAAKERSGLFASHPDMTARMDAIAREIRSHRFSNTALVQARYSEFVKFPRTGGGSRGLNPDRDARGGPVKTAIAVTVTEAEIAEFRNGIAG